MRRGLSSRFLAGLAAAAALSIGTVSPAMAAGADGPPPSTPQGLARLKILGMEVPLNLPVSQVPVPLLLSPILDLEVPTTPATDPRFDGRAIGLYAEIHVGDAVAVETGIIGADYAGNSYSGRHAASIDWDGWPVTFTIEGATSTSSHYASSYYGTRRLDSESEIAHVDLSGLLEIESLVSSVRVTQSGDGTYETTTNMTFENVTISGTQLNQQEIPPNTTFDVPGLGTVIFNEQTITATPGDQYSAKVHAVHIKLDTGQFGLPVGADIYIGTAEGVLYD